MKPFMSFTSVAEAFWSTFGISSNEATGKGVMMILWLGMSNDRHRIIHLVLAPVAVSWEGKDVFLPSVLAQVNRESLSYSGFQEWDVVHRPALGDIGWVRKVEDFLIDVVERVRSTPPFESREDDDYRFTFFTHGLPHIVSFEKVEFFPDLKKATVKF